jgi:hypothetical protein
MKILLYAGAFALLLSGGTVAQSATQAGAKTRAHLVHKRVHAVRPVQPNPPQDPWAAYWKDPSRSGPFSYRGFQ